MSPPSNTPRMLTLFLLIFGTCGRPRAAVWDHTISLTLPAEGFASRVCSYLLAGYTLNGTYLGLSELTTELQLCTGGAADPTAFLDFGTGQKITCNVPVGELLDVQTPTFYDMCVEPRSDRRLRSQQAQALFVQPARIALNDTTPVPPPLCAPLHTF